MILDKIDIVWSLTRQKVVRIIFCKKIWKIWNSKKCFCLNRPKTYFSPNNNILTPAKAISKASYGVKKGNAAAERVLEILESENPIKNIEGAEDKTDFTFRLDGTLSFCPEI